MVKKYFIAFLSVFMIFVSVQGSYVKAASSAEEMLGVIGKIEKGLFVSAAYAVGATAAIGVKSKELYDNNKEKIADAAGKAYDAMSDAAKASWRGAVAAGHTTADMAGEVWDSLKDVMKNVFSGTVSTPLPGNMKLNASHVTDGEVYFTIDNGYFKLKNVAAEWPNNQTFYINKLNMGISSGSVVFNNSNWSTYPISLNTEEYLSYRNFFNGVSDIYSAFAVMSSLMARASNASTNKYTLSLVDANKTVISDVGTDLPNPIYDQTLKRALETDIPRFKDAGLVLPNADVRTPSGTKLDVHFGDNTGTLTLPDGSIYRGEIGDLVLGIPDTVISGDKVIYRDKANGIDTDVATGEKVHTGTGEAVIPGTLDKILEGIKDIPADIGALLTKLFVPVTSIPAFADLTNTLQSRLVLPSFGWLVTDGIVCSQDGKDIKIEFNGKETTFVDMSWLYRARSFYMPIMRGFLWFLFGWYAYRKIIAITNKVDGIKE